MSDYDFWEEQEQAEREYDAQQEEIADAYERGYEKGKADAIEEFTRKLESHLRSEADKEIMRFIAEQLKNPPKAE